MKDKKLVDKGHKLVYNKKKIIIYVQNKGVNNKNKEEKGDNMTTKYNDEAVTGLYPQGTELKLKKVMSMPPGYKKLKKGSKVIVVELEKRQHEYPYIVEFDNGYRMHLSEYELNYYTN